MNQQLDSKKARRLQNQYQNYKVQSSQSLVKSASKAIPESLPKISRNESLPEILKKSPYIAPSMLSNSEKKFKKKLSENTIYIPDSLRFNKKKVYKLRRDGTDSGQDTPSQHSALQMSDNNRIILPTVQRSRNDSIHGQKRIYTQQHITTNNTQLYIGDSYQTIQQRVSKPPIPKITIHNKLKGNIIVMQAHSPIQKSPDSNYKQRPPSMWQLNRSIDFAAGYVPRSQEYNINLRNDFGIDTTNIVYDPIDENQEIILGIGKRVNKLMPINPSPNFSQSQNFSYSNFLSDLMNLNKKEINRSQNLSRVIDQSIDQNMDQDKIIIDDIETTPQQLNDSGTQPQTLGMSMIHDDYSDIHLLDKQQQLKKSVHVEIQTEDPSSVAVPVYKEVLSDKNKFFDLCFGSFRQLLRVNSEGMLKRAVLQKFKYLALEKYRESLRINKNKMLMRCLNQKLINLGLEKYKHMLQINKHKLLKRLLDKKLVHLSIQKYKQLNDQIQPKFIKMLLDKKLLVIYLKEYECSKEDQLLRLMFKKLQTLFLNQFRQMLQFNRSKLLKRLLDMRLVNLALQKYRDSLKTNKSNMLRLLLDQKLISLGLISYNRVNRASKIKLNFLKSKLSQKYQQKALNVFRESLRVNRGKMLQRLFGKKLVEIALKSYQKLNRVSKIKFNFLKNKVFQKFQLVALTHYRESLRTNKGNLMKRLINNKILNLSLDKYRESLITNKAKMLKRLLEKKLVELALKSYQRLSRVSKIKFNFLKNKVFQKFQQIALTHYRDSLKTNKAKMLKRLLNKKLVDLSLNLYFKKALRLRKIKFNFLKNNVFKTFQQLALKLYRESLLCNRSKMLHKLVQKRLLHLSLEHYNKKAHRVNKIKFNFIKNNVFKTFLRIALSHYSESLRTNKQKMLKRLLDKKLVNLGLDCYRKHLRLQKIRFNILKNKVNKFLVQLALSHYRESLRVNKQNMMKRLVDKKLLYLSLESYSRKSQRIDKIKFNVLKKQVFKGILLLALNLYREALRLNKQRLLKRLFDNKLMSLGLDSYRKHLRHRKIKFNVLKNTVFKYIGQLSINHYRESLRTNKQKMLKRLLDKKIFSLAMDVYRKHLRLRKIKFNILKNKVFKYILQLSLNHFRESTRTNKNKMLRQLYINKLKQISLAAYSSFKSQQSIQLSNQPRKLTSQVLQSYTFRITKEELRTLVNQKFVRLSLNSLHRMRVRIIFSNKDGLINYAVSLLREMIRRNYQRLLKKVFDRKLLKLSVESYQSYKEYKKQKQTHELSREYADNMMNSINMELYGPENKPQSKESSPVTKIALNSSPTQIPPNFLKNNQDLISALNLDTIEGQQMLQELVQKVNEAYVIEFESENDNERQDGKNEQSEISSINKNIDEDKRPSGSSNESSGNFIDSLVNQLHKGKNEAQLPQMTQTEIGIIQQQEEEKEGEIYENDQTSENVSRRIPFLESKISLKTDMTQKTRAVKKQMLPADQRICEEEKKMDSVLQQNQIEERGGPVKSRGEIDSAIASNSSFYPSENERFINQSPMMDVKTQVVKAPLQQVARKTQLHSIEQTYGVKLNRMTTEKPNISKHKIKNPATMLSYDKQNPGTKKLGFNSDLNSPAQPNTKAKPSTSKQTPSQISPQNAKSTDRHQIIPKAKLSQQSQQKYAVTTPSADAKIDNKVDIKASESKAINKEAPSQQQNVEDVTKLIKVFKDLDISRQQMIIKALEPHLISGGQKGKKKKVKIQLKKYSDFLNKSEHQ